MKNNYYRQYNPNYGDDSSENICFIYKGWTYELSYRNNKLRWVSIKTTIDPDNEKFIEKNGVFREDSEMIDHANIAKKHILND